ncbi:MAG: O-antigen ligase family protein [Verrucomicrobiae bacterium]|nr:O-antigen ligase family protein [Verrucomicrobiae bacterium]
MSNTLAIIRSVIIYGLCLPLAIYLGYLLANPADRISLAVIAVACLLPLIPALMRWHHLLLIISWNMSMVLFFIQGSPYLWMVMTALSLTLTVLQQVLKRNVKFNAPSTLVLPLMFLALIIAGTAQLTGGIGLAAFGGDSFGGKRYIQLLVAIAGFFAIVSHRIPPERANLYVGLYFLGGVTALVGSLAPWIPGGLRMIYALFPVDDARLFFNEVNTEYLRLNGLTVAAMSALCFIFALHGLSGLLGIGERARFLPLQFRGGFGLNQPWRVLVFLGLVALAASGGYRSYLITIILYCGALFFLEGLFRSKLSPPLLLLAVLIPVVTLPLADKLPLTIQRSLSFLPIEIDPRAEMDAENSSEWRLKIWEQVIPTIPQYLLIGKGYSIDAREFEKIQTAGQSSSQATAEYAQDYHSGPLSLLIPLGSFGVVGFVWFLVAAYRVLRNNYRHGPPEYRKLNTFLFAFFLVRTFMFIVIYGSFQNDLVVFTGIVALSLSLNGGVRQPALAPAKPNPAYLPFRLPKPVRL